MDNGTIVMAAVALVVLVLAILLLLRKRPSEPGGGVADEAATAVADTMAPMLGVEPAPEPAIIPAAGAPDDLTALKGLGPRAAAKLNELGVTRYDQIAAWNDADAALVDARMGQFAGRITRDKWVEQARFLCRGDRAGFEAAFGKLTS